MRILGIIPARYHSSRFPGKPLALIQNKPMIYWVYQQAVKCKCFLDVVVATDHEEIYSTVTGFGGKAVMTSSAHQSGTERILEVLTSIECDGVINIQGDEPLISPELLTDLCLALKKNQYPLITAAYKNYDYQSFLSPHHVKVVCNLKNEAMLFSRSPIPFVNKIDFNYFYNHIGIYGYLLDSLKEYKHLTPGYAEKIEKLEQLRYLENSLAIKVVYTKYESIGVDVPSDINTIEKILFKG
jgi:3-deoxy-manno-octulosonate cytidylyltransferase (CMP-KDO synthetase)